VSPIRPSTQGTGGAKILGGILLGGGVVAALTFLKDSVTALAIFGGGLVLVVLAWLVYAAITARKDKAQAGMMSQAIAASAAATPTGISNPAKRARLDDLRKSFEKGLDKFKAADKDVYSVPWYLVVGEPGSGKTEAIRHCKIGFPPGLQDPLQGAGGTVNMHWWFTNHGVFLDTAGRLMFEEVEPGNTSEWQEFMRLLTKARPNCPINGMLLFIPADALIKDSAEVLEKKGAKIAQQLDQIQRELGVRFPVYVIVAKCDLVNGFREFFDDITDPKLQDQIVGWSSPASLDTPFKPEQVDDYIKQVQDRLVRRRYGVLMDPVHTEDPKLRRAEQVDALYAFPDSLGKLSTRLRRYLEMVFVAGAWSAKPLFLRGIYFTSSMREGSALDQELAEALGVSIDKLPEGRVWEKDRSFFLRDVFLEKAFPEQGLVSRAANVAKQLRGWKHAVLGLMGGGAIVVAALTWLGYRGLDSAIVSPARFWDGARDVFIAKGEKPVRDEVFFRPVVEKLQGESGYAYLGDQSPDGLKDIAGLSAEHATLARFPLALKDQATRQVEVPIIFRPIAALLGDRSGNLLASERLTAARTLFEGSWLRPVYSASKDRLSADASASVWSSGATEALASLMRLEVGNLPSLPKERKGELGPPDLKGTLRYAIGPKFDSAAGDAEQVQTFAAWLYNRQGGGQDWPSAAMSSSSADLIDRSLTTFTKVWTGESVIEPGAAIGTLPKLRALVAMLNSYDAKEAELLALAARATDPQAIKADWLKTLGELRGLESRITPELTSLSGKALETAYAEQLKAFKDAGNRQHDMLDEALRAVSSAGPDDARARPIAAWQKSIRDSKAALASDAPAFSQDKQAASKHDQRLLGTLAAPAFASRLKMYQVVADRLSLSPPQGEIAIGDVDTRLDDTEARAAADGDSIKASAGALGAPTPDALAACQKLLDLAAKGERSATLAALYASKRAQNAPSLIAAIRELAQSTKDDSAKPALPLATWESAAAFDPQNTPKAASKVLGDFVRAQRTMELEGQSSMVLNQAALAKAATPSTQAIGEYLREFAAVWSGVSEKVSVPAGAYTGVQQAMSAGVGVAMTGGLESVIAKMEAAARVSGNVRDGWAALGTLPEVDRLSKAAASSRASMQTLKAGIEAAALAWSKLPASGPDAQRALALSGAQMLAQYAAIPSKRDEGDVASAYTTKLWCAAFTSVAAEQGSSPAMAAMQEINTLGAKFPLLGRSEGGVLNKDELAQLAAAIDRFNSDSADTGSPAPMNESCIDQAASRIIAQQRPTPQAREYVQRVSQAMVSIAPKGGEPLALAIVPSADAATRDRSAASLAPVWQLFAAGEPAGQRTDVSKATGSLGRVTLPSDKDIELRLIGQGNRVVGRVALGDGWSLLQRVERSGQRNDALGPRRVWSVAVPVTIDGREWLAHLDLEFTRPLPEANWLP
jgi:IcmF-related N-terminal domain